MLLLSLLLNLSLPAWAQLSVTCATATAGGTAQCTASGGTSPYAYSVSAGSGSINSSSGVYTAPATVEVKQKVGPCPLLSPDHIYNTRIDALPVHADSATIIAKGGTDQRILFEPSLNFNIVTNSTPTFSYLFNYTPLNNGTFPFLDWPLGKIQSGWFLTPYGIEDRHIFTTNRETCEFSDVYNKYPPASNANCPTCNSAGGLKYSSDLSMPANGASDAAFMLMQPVTLRLSDIQSGALKHALRFTMGNSRIQSGIATNWQWPAKSGTTAGTCAAPCWKYGMYTRLKSSVDISSFSATAQIILTGLKQYGMIMTDGGTNWGVTSSTDLALDKDARAALREIYYSSLRNADFEVVDTSGAYISTSSAAVNLSAITPSQYAEVTVTDAAMATATTRVNLAGIAVGVAEQTMTVMAGHTVTPTWWVTGTGTQTVTWTMDPDVGTINSSTGEFTPDSRTSPTRTRLTATSTVEATAQAFIDVVVWPDNASGNIYADWGPGDTTSKTYGGNTFWPSEWTQAEGWNGIVGENTAGGDIFTNVQYYLHDTIAKWYLPNGNYKARVYVRSNGTGSIDPSQYQIHYESQGKLIYRNYSIGRATGGLHNTGGYVDLPLYVTDGSGTLAWRHLTNTGSYTYIAAIAIEADATDPHLEIDNGGQTGNITISQTRQFYAVGWYMSDSVTWSVASGPGSIDANGLYTAPSAPPATPQTVTVRATSTVDAMIYAETTFNFAFGTVVVTGPSSVSRGQTAQFSASIGGVTYNNVTWSRSGSQGSISPTGLYSAPGSIVDGTTTITATPIDAGGSAGNTDLELNQLIDPIRVNLAWTALTENGRTWQADPGPCTLTGTTSAAANGGTVTGMPAPEQLPLYNTPRYKTSSGTFTYACPVPSGVYQVTMKWANNNATNFKAKLHIDIEGNRKITDFDVTAEAGGVLLAVDRTVYATVVDGSLTLDVVGVSNAPSQTMWAVLNAFEIIDLGPVPGNARITGGVTLTNGRVQ